MDRHRNNISLTSQSIQFSWNDSKEMKNKKMIRDVTNKSKTHFNEYANNESYQSKSQPQNTWARPPTIKKRKVMRSKYDEEGKPNYGANKENCHRENEMKNQMTDTNSFEGGNSYGYDQGGYHDNDYCNNYNNNDNKARYYDGHRGHNKRGGYRNHNNNKGGGYGNNGGNSGGGAYGGNNNNGGYRGNNNNNNGGYGNNGYQHENRGGFRGRGYSQNQYNHNINNRNGSGRARGTRSGSGYRSGVREPGHRYGGGRNNGATYASKYNSYSGKKPYEHGNLNSGHRKNKQQWNKQHDFDDDDKMNKSTALQQKNNGNTNYSKSTRKSENNKKGKLLPICKESDVEIFRKYNKRVLLHIYSDDCEDADEFNKILHAIAEENGETIFCKIEWQDINNLKDELNLVLVDLPVVICFIDNKDVRRWNKLNWAKDSLFGNLDVEIVKDALFQQKMINRNGSYGKDNTAFFD